MKRILINLALMILAFTIQTCIFPLIPFFSASPNLLLILTFSMGFIYGNLNGIFSRYYYEDYITLPMVLAIVNELAYNLYIYVFQFLIRRRLNILYYLKNIIIPEIIFTVVTTLLIYRLFLFISRKLEEMEQRRDTNLV